MIDSVKNMLNRVGIVHRQNDSTLTLAGVNVVIDVVGDNIIVKYNDSNLEPNGLFDFAIILYNIMRDIDCDTYRVYLDILVELFGMVNAFNYNSSLNMVTSTGEVKKRFYVTCDYVFVDMDTDEELCLEDMIKCLQ